MLFQISAQESRRKKKEFVDTLEKKVEEASSELEMYKKKCDELLKENSSLADQVRALRAMLERHQAAGAHHVGLKMEPADGNSDSFLAAVDGFVVCS